MACLSLPQAVTEREGGMLEEVEATRSPNLRVVAVHDAASRCNAAGAWKDY